MAAPRQTARRLLETRPDPRGDAAFARVRIELDCGCVTARRIHRSRIVEDESTGEVFVAGKFSCSIHSAGSV